VVKSTCKKFTNYCFQCKTTNFDYLNHYLKNIG